MFLSLLFDCRRNLFHAILKNYYLNEFEKKGKLFCHSKLFLVFGYFKQFQSTECITLKMCVVWSFRLVGFFAFSINRSKNRWNAVNWVWLRFFVLYLLSYKKTCLPFTIATMVTMWLDAGSLKINLFYFNRKIKITNKI